MKRFSKVVRHPHKLTQWSAGYRKVADFKKKKKNVLFCDEQNITHLERHELTKEQQQAPNVLSAWNALRRSQNNAETLMNLLEVLLHTCVNPCECLIEFIEPNGDIRSYLCDKRLVSQLLIKLAPNWEVAVDMLDLTDSTRDTLIQLKPTSKNTLSKELYVLFGWTCSLNEQEIPSSHLCELMPWLSNQDNLDARILCDDWERLPSPLLGNLLFAVSDPISLRSWMNVLLTLNAERGEKFIWILAKHDSTKHPIYEDVAPMLCYAFYQEEKLEYESRVSDFIHYLYEGTSAYRLLCLTKLEAHYDRQATFYSRSIDGLWDFEAILPLLPYADRDEVFRMWAHKFTNECWSYAVERREHYQLSEKASQEFVNLLIDQCNYLGSDLDFIMWFIESAAKALHTIHPKYHHKLRKLYYMQFDGGDNKNSALQMERMIQILCTGKMSTTNGICDVLTEIEDASVQQLFIDLLEHKGWQHLDLYCRSENRASTLSKGLEILFEKGTEYTQLIITALNSAPAAVLNAVHEIGKLSKIQQREFFQWLEYHPLLFCQSASLSERCLLISNASYDHPSVSLPTKLIAASGESTSYRKEVIAKEKQSLLTAELRMLFTEIADYLGNQFLRLVGVDGIETHTATFIQTASSNKRGGKKALKQYREKGEVARLLHPSNILWFQKPKSFWRPAIWIKGIKQRTTLKTIGEVLIETESRFEEILKMGTYVNSCLSMGGCNQHSAIANVLDANKRVLFLRDKNDKFIARQLLAITKERKLACFEVYHSGHQHDKKIIHAYFTEINQAFANELGVSIQDKQEYEIETVVCPDWYDDGIWIPESSAEAQ